MLGEILNLPGLTNLYHFEGNSNDSKGTYNGTDTAISYGGTYGKLRQGLLGNGTTSKITFGGPSLTGDLAVMALLKRISGQSGIYGDSNDSGGVCAAVFYVSSGSKLVFGWAASWGVNGKVWISSASVPTGEWVFSGLNLSGSTVTLYIGTKANLIKEVPTPTIWGAGDRAAHQTTRAVDVGGANLNGDMDELAVFNGTTLSELFFRRQYAHIFGKFLVD